MCAGAAKTQCVCFSRQRNRPTALAFTLGAIIIATVDKYRYLGLLYSHDWKWNAHYEVVIDRARRASYLRYRIISTRGPPGVDVIIALVKSMLIPTIAFGFPSVQEAHLTVAPLRRVLRLHSTTHQLSVLAECGVPNIRVLYDQLALTHARRCHNLRHTHPSYSLITSPAPQFFFTSVVADVERRWALTASLCTPGAIKKAAARQQMVSWRDDGKVRDLLALRPVSATGAAAYIGVDRRC